VKNDLNPQPDEFAATPSAGCLLEETLHGELSLLRLLRADFFQFGFQAMPQGAFRPQFVQQSLRLSDNSCVNFFGAKQVSPTSRDLLFGKQFAPRRKNGR
jgi:hypothetical protein